MFSTNAGGECGGATDVAEQRMPEANVAELRMCEARMPGANVAELRMCEARMSSTFITS